MKHAHSLWALILCLGLLAVPATVQAVDFSILGGVWDPENGDDSFGVGARLAFFDKLQLEVGASYYEQFEPRFRIEQRNNRFEVRSTDLEVIPVEAGLRYNFGEPSRGFYLGGGVGWYMIDADVRGDLDDELGLYGKAGWQYRHLFLELIYRDLSGDFEDFEFDRFRFRRADIDLSGFGIQVGWRF